MKRLVLQPGERLCLNAGSAGAVVRRICKPAARETTVCLWERL